MSVLSKFWRTHEKRSLPRLGDSRQTCLFRPVSLSTWYGSVPSINHCLHQDPSRTISTTLSTMSNTLELPRSPNHAVEGSCACGQIKYTGSEMPMSMTNCHCRQCQKLGSAPYLTWAAVDKASLTWNAPPKLLKLSAIAERTICQNCGSSMTMQYHFQPQRLSIAAGTIDGSTAPLPQPGEHIFLSEKASWFNLPQDGINRFDEFDPPFQRKLETWKKEHLDKS